MFVLFKRKFFLDGSYSHQKVNVRVASRVGKRLKIQDLRKLRNIKKILEMLGFDGECPAVQTQAKF